MFSSFFDCFNHKSWYYVFVIKEKLMNLTNYQDDPNRVNPPNDCEIDEQAYEQLVTDKALEMLADDSNYLLVGEAFEDLPDELYALFEDADLKFMLYCVSQQNAEALGNYIFCTIALNGKKTAAAFGEYARGTIVEYFRRIADMKLG